MRPARLWIERCREAATGVMLVALAGLCGGRARERWASFLWAFAVWDLSYYAGLWFTVRWPASLREVDVLFLIPGPWVAQVWFPVVISLLTIVGIAMVPGGER